MCRRYVVLWLAVLAAVPLVSVASARAENPWQAIEFSAGITPGCSITDITTGPDGNLWFSEYANQAIGRITPQGKAVEFPLPYDAGQGAAGFPGGIAVGPDRNLWFVRRNGVVGRITPQGSITEFHDGITGFSSQVTTTELPNRIVAGPDGALWFTEPDGAIGRITTAGAVTEFREGITTYYLSQLGTLAGIAVGPDRNVWFTDPQGAIGRITTAGAVTEFTEGIAPSAVPGEIVAGPDGNLWFTELYGGRIGRITPQGTVTQFSAAITPNSYPSGIARGPDGNLWFGERQGRIGRITPQGTVTEFAAGPNANPTAVTRGPDDAIWYATSDRIGRLGPAGGGSGGGGAGGRSVRPRVTLGAISRGRLRVTVSRRVILTARVGRHRLRVALHTGRNTVRLPAWLVAAARRGVTLTATDRAGNATRVVLRTRRTRRGVPR